MAYNNFYPNYNYPTYPTYPQYQPQQAQQPMPQAQTPQTPQQLPPQIQNGGFISAPSEQYAREYAVAPGNSVTFKNENAPYCYTKTMGFSPFEQPIFKKYRLVEEEDVPAPASSEMPTERKDTSFVTRAEFDGIAGEIQTITNNMDGFVNDIDILRKEIAELKAKTEVRKTARTKKESDEV